MQRNKFVIIGTSGSGKTYLAKNLSLALNFKHIELDLYNHGSNWEQAEPEVFQHEKQELHQDGKSHFWMG